jgi:hypothetical protein
VHRRPKPRAIDGSTARSRSSRSSRQRAGLLAAHSVMIATAAREAKSSTPYGTFDSVRSKKAYNHMLQMQTHNLGLWPKVCAHRESDALAFGEVRPHGVV